MSQSASKLPIIIGVLVFFAIAVGAYFFIAGRIDGMVSNQQEELKITEAMPQQIKQLLSAAAFNDGNYSFGDMTEGKFSVMMRPSFKKYLYFHDGIMGGVATHLQAIYSNSVNKKLGTDKYLHDPALDGIIIQHTGTIELHHEDKTAYRLYHTHTYIGLPQRAPLYRDTVWGSMPKFTFTGEVVNGKEPSANDDAAGVRSVLN